MAVATTAAATTMAAAFLSAFDVSFMWHMKGVAAAVAFVGAFEVPLTWHFKGVAAITGVPTKGIIILKIRFLNFLNLFNSRGYFE